MSLGRHASMRIGARAQGASASQSFAGGEVINAASTRDLHTLRVALHGGAGGSGLETALYRPVKKFLQRLGYEVKGEIGECDLVALKGDAPPVVVIGELKLSFNLDLVLQGVDRSASCDEVWLAVRASSRGRGRERDPRVRKLCRFLGFGLLGVFPRGQVELLVEPGPWRPRRDTRNRSRLVEEHRRRIGDPIQGGSTRQPMMTAYRQRALACAAALAVGPRTTRELRLAIPEAPKILLHNVYGWFMRKERGCYELTA